eukprot:2481879-Ditylum_brightwellii.AAC.1
MSKYGLDNNSDTDDLKKGLKRALDNQFLMDKGAYPCSLLQAMKLLEQFKPEVLAEAMTGKPGGDSSVAFAQTEGYAPTSFNCCAKGHT